MKIDGKIKNENLQYDINKEAAKISLSSGKIDKCEYLTDEEVLPPDQVRVKEQAKCTYYGNSFRRGNKNNSGSKKKVS